MFGHCSCSSAAYHSVTGCGGGVSASARLVAPERWSGWGGRRTTRGGIPTQLPQRGDGRRGRMRALDGSVPGRGGEAYAGAGRGEPGEDPRGGVRSGRPGGEPDAEAETRGARDGAGEPQEGAGAAAGGKGSRCSAASGSGAGSAVRSGVSTPVYAWRFRLVRHCAA